MEFMSGYLAGCWRASLCNTGLVCLGVILLKNTIDTDVYKRDRHFDPSTGELSCCPVAASYDDHLQLRPQFQMLDWCDFMITMPEMHICMHKNRSTIHHWTQLGAICLPSIMCHNTSPAFNFYDNRILSAASHWVPQKIEFEMPLLCNLLVPSIKCDDLPALLSLCVHSFALYLTTVVLLPHPVCPHINL